MYALRFKMTNLFKVSLVAMAAMLAAFPLAMVATTKPVEAAFPGQNGKIAFDSERDGNVEIFTMNPDGSNQTNISNNPTLDARPAWSPDGTKIAFVSDLESGNNDIFVMNADGSSRTRLTDWEGSDGSPAWSPDGTKIVFDSDRDGDQEIYTMNPDGSNVTRLTNNSAVDENPEWSPDGTKIAFQNIRAGVENEELFLMNPDGSNQTNISNNSAADVDPEWSPDGTKIAFWSRRAGPGQIFLMNADGSNQTNISNTLSGEGQPSWSPDGTKIAFVSLRNGNNEIYTMNSDGSNQTRLTTHATSDIFPDWQPITASTNTAPTITSLRPPPGSSTTDRTPIIAATVADQQTNLAKSNITLLLDDETIPRTSYSYNLSIDRMSYTPEKKRSFGRHAVKVIAEDGSGLSTTKRWSFEIVHP
jgi:Tol biopolymer transport system component